MASYVLPSALADPQLMMCHPTRPRLSLEFPRLFIAVSNRQFDRVHRHAHLGFNFNRKESDDEKTSERRIAANSTALNNSMDAP